jgi:hypothetical protein
MKTLILMFAGLAVLLLGFFHWLARQPLARNRARRLGYRLGLQLRFALAWLASPFAQFGRAKLRPGTAQFCNISEGTRKEGILMCIPDAATTKRYLLYKRGVGTNTTVNNSCCLTANTTDYPLGVSEDMAETANISQGIAIALFGVVTGTLRVISDGTIVDGSWVGPSGATAGYATVATTGNSCFGRAIIPEGVAIAAGEPVEVIHSLPSKLAF